MDADVVEELRALDAEHRRIEARRAFLVRQVERRDVHRADGHLSVSGWLRATLSWSTAECRARGAPRSPARARAAVGDALIDGSCGVAQTDELARAAANPRVGGEIDPFLPVFVEHAPRLSFDEFKTIVRRWENLADADGAHRSREASVRRRRARITIDDAVVRLTAEGGALEGVMMREIFDAFLTAEVLDRSGHHGRDRCRAVAAHRCPAAFRCVARDLPRGGVHAGGCGAAGVHRERGRRPGHLRTAPRPPRAHPHPDRPPRPVGPATAVRERPR